MRKKIPGASSYEVDDSGRVYDHNGNLRNTYRNGDGYITTLIRTDDGDFATVGVHRLVALAYKPEERSIERCHVNHLDGDIENNTPPNVDWETPANNNLHASLISKPGKARKLVVANVVAGGATNLFRYYSNLWEVAESLAMTIGDTWKAFRDQVIVDGKRIYLNTNLGPEYHKENIVSRDELGRQPKRQLKMKNLNNGVVVMGYASELARKFDTSAAHITTSVSDESLRLFKDSWVIVDNMSEFPEIDEETFNYLKERGKPKKVVAVNLSDNSMYFFHSAAAFIKATGLSKKSVTTKLKRDGMGKSGVYVFAYKHNFNIDNLRSL